MDVTKIKASLHQLIDQVHDKNLLDTYLKILENTTGHLPDDFIIGHTTNGKPLTISSLQKEVHEASLRVKSGDFISQEDLEANAKYW